MSNIDESKRLLKKFFSETPKEEIKAMIDKIDRDNTNHNDQPVRVIKTEASGDKMPLFFTNELIEKRLSQIEEIKTVSVAFAEWLEEKHYWKSTDTRFPNTLGRWTDEINGDVPFEESYTAEELFDIFIKQYNP